ncbi:TPA: hypothetical protein ACU9T0_006129 [Burkholderia cenocepacia]|uniref:hypothetical protein n=1 Tax=Burkholderia TaxID=32008 RepID=UPI001FC802C7|nr:MULTISPECIES: hypothetical protein [Burkholderia]
MRLVGLIVAFGCLVIAPQLHAERMNRGWDQGNHARVTHHGARHYDHHRHGVDDYYDAEDDVYAAPPMVYAPAPAPGVSLFIPLRLR